MFQNNLTKDDRIYDTVADRQGKVKTTPQSPSQRKVAIIYDGTASAVYRDVMQLRLVVKGVPEEVPPVDGTPPAEEAKAPRTAAVSGSALDLLKATKKRNEQAMEDMTATFKKLKAENEKIDKAITALSE